MAPDTSPTLNIPHHFPLLTTRAMELSHSSSINGFLRRNRSYVSDASTGWESAGNVCRSSSAVKHCLAAAMLPDFFEAVKSGNTEMISKVLTQHPDIIECRDVHQNDALHMAVASGDVEVIRHLSEHSKNFSAKDIDGNTALHLAAAENSATIVDLLLQFKADPHEINGSGDTAIHLAVRCGSENALKALLEHFASDVNVPGWNGETPLHVAASKNELGCAKLLIARHADIRRRCQSGGEAIHYGASFGGLDVVCYILQIPGVSVAELLNSLDGEEATPLHLAVNGGDPDITRVLLEAGASITAQMFEGSTPIHIACVLGAADIVDMAREISPGELDKALHTEDAQGMTPIHRAAMFNHWSLLHSLIEKKSLLNVRDCSGRTVLVLAASRGAWDAVLELLGCGADPMICSNDGQNFLHYVVALGGNPEMFKDDIRPVADFEAILNGRDHAGHTPLHYAAQCGFGNCCDSLIKLGAVISAKSQQVKTPLHLAAEFGRYSTLKKLLNAAAKNPAFHGVINDTDSKGQTALHLAAANGQVKVVLLLVSKGALLVRDVKGALPIHLACAANKKDALEVLLSSHAHLINSIDKIGNTPLHYAAENNAAVAVDLLLTGGAQSLTNHENLTAIDLAIMQGHRDVAEAVINNDRWDELLLQPSSVYTWPIHGLIQEFPDVMLKVLDKCQTTSGTSSLAKDYCVSYDYRILQPDLNDDTIAEKKARKPLESLNHMAHWKRVDLLCHPVCTTYLEAKWWSYGLLFHATTLTLYVTFLTLLTYLVLAGIDFDLRPNLRQVSIDRIRKHKPELLANNATMVGPVDLSLADDNVTAGTATLLALVISFALFHLLKKLLQLKREGITYFIRLITLLELTLYVSTMLFCIGFYDEDNYYMSWESQWLLGAVAIFFAWVNLFFYVRRYGEIGMHVVILLRCMKTLTEAMVVLFVVVMTFSITFFTLNPIKMLPKDPNFYTKNHAGDGPMDLYWTAYSTLQSSILRVSDQMIGDADVIVNFINPILDGFMIFPVLTYMLAMISIVVITILLQSLIIGLTVGDIRYLRETVTLQRKIMQVDLHTEIEENFSSNLMASWDIEPVRKVYPNKLQSRFLKSFLYYLSASAEKEDNSDTLEVQKTAAQMPSRHDMEFKDKMTAELSAKADQQHELLRTVVQYMNIELEADVLDDEDIDIRRKKLSRFVDSAMAERIHGSTETDG